MPAMWFDNYCLRDVGPDGMDIFGTTSSDLDVPNPAGENALDMGSLSETFTCWTQGLSLNQQDTSSQSFNHNEPGLSFITSKFGSRVISHLNEYGYSYSVHSMEAQDDLLVMSWSLGGDRSVLTTLRILKNTKGESVLVVQSPMLKGTTTMASENPWALNFRIPLVFQSALFMAERPNRDPMMWDYRTSAFPGIKEELLPEPFVSINSPAHIPVSIDGYMYGIDCGIGFSLGYTISESMNQLNLGIALARCLGALTSVHEVFCDVVDNAGMEYFYEGIGLRKSFDVMYQGDLYPVWWNGA
jgi:hypothetical protein